MQKNSPQPVELRDRTRLQGVGGACRVVDLLGWRLHSLGTIARAASVTVPQRANVMPPQWHTTLDPKPLLSVGKP